MACGACLPQAPIDTACNLKPLGTILPQFSAGTHVAGTTYMRAFDVVYGSATIGVRLSPPGPGDGEVWRLTASANGQPVGSSALLLNTRTTPAQQVTVQRTAAAVGKHGTVVVEAGALPGCRVG